MLMSFLLWPNLHVTLGPFFDSGAVLDTVGFDDEIFDRPPTKLTVC